MLSTKKNLRNLAALLLLLSLTLGIVATGGCTTTTESESGALDQQTQAPVIETISAQEAFDLIQENAGNADFVIVDVRTAEEFAGGHIENAVNIDYYASTFESDINALDKDKEYLIYCRSGSRSGKALDIMEDLGFQEVYDLGGGIVAWTNAGLPVTGTNGQGLNGDDPM